MAAALVMLAACSDGGDGAIGAPSATVPTLPPQTTTTNPYAVPDVIDADYVNRVLAGLDASFGDIVRELVRTKALPPSTPDRLKALYGNLNFLNNQYEALQTYERFTLSQLPDTPGNKVTTVSELMTASRSCIYAAVTRDYSLIAGRQQPTRKEWVALTPIDPATDPMHINPTGWVWIYEGSDSEGNPPRNSPCTAARS